MEARPDARAELNAAAAGATPRSRIPSNGGGCASRGQALPRRGSGRHRADAYIHARDPELARSAADNFFALSHSRSPSDHPTSNLPAA